MYLHLGQDVVVQKNDIIAVFDLDNSSQSHITRDFLKKAEQKGSVINISEDLPKSFVLIEKNGKKMVYLSQLSSATLLKRSDEEAF